MDGQGQNPVRQLFASWQVAFYSSEVGEAGLEMQGNRVVDGGSDSRLIEMDLEPIPILSLNYILVEHMTGSVGRGNHLAIQAGVMVGTLPPRFLESPQLGKLLKKEGRLNRVHPEIEAHLMVVIILATMLTKTAHSVSEVRIPGGGESRVTGRAQVLSRETGETGGGSEGPAGPFLSDRPDRLSSVFENWYGPSCGDGNGFSQGPDGRRAQCPAHALAAAPGGP